MDIKGTEEVFRSELDSIRDKSKRNFVLEVLASLPDYFFEKPSSSTGKYHSPLTNGYRGLVLHVKMAAACVNEICDLEFWGFDDIQKDNIRAAVILHDGLKYGDGSTQYTVFDHPVLMASYIRDSRWDSVLPLSVREEIAGLVETHHGQWNHSKKTDVILPKPSSKAQFFVHLCDYLASRRNVLFRIDEISQFYDDMMQNCIFGKDSNRTGDPEKEDTVVLDSPMTGKVSFSEDLQADRHQTEEGMALYTDAGEILCEYIPDIGTLKNSAAGDLSAKVRRLQEQLTGHHWDGRLLTDGGRIYVCMDSILQTIDEGMVAPLVVLGQALRDRTIPGPVQEKEI